MACLEKKAISDEDYQDTERTKRFLVIILLVLGLLWIGSFVSAAISLVVDWLRREEQTA